MTVLAIVEPSGLVARELREQLGRRPELWRELRLLTANEEEVGTLTDVAGSAAVVQSLAPAALEDVDLAFLCGAVGPSRELIAGLPGETRAVLLSPGATAADAPPRVAGVNLPADAGGGGRERVLLSPHPGAILLAHLLHPLRPLGLLRAEATLLQPISVFAPEALDQLFEQARGLLTFQKTPPASHWHGQLAFNLHPTGDAGELVRAQVHAILDGAAEVATQVVQAGVFHSYSASVHVAFAGDPAGDPAGDRAGSPGVEAVREALSAAPWLRWADQEPLGPVDAAGAEEVLLGPVRPDGARPGAFWLWSVMDNLTRGGASNAVALAEALLG